MSADPTSAERQRARRRRLRHCLGLWRVEADVALIDRLIERGFLSEVDADDHAAVEIALSHFVGEALKIPSRRDTKLRLGLVIDPSWPFDQAGHRRHRD